MVLEQLTPKEQPRLEVIFGDNKYHNHSLKAWMKSQRPDWEIKVESPPPGTKGFSAVRKRWVVERSNAWHGRCRRNSQDYERRPDSAEAMIKLSHIGIMMRRCAPLRAAARRPKRIQISATARTCPSLPKPQFLMKTFSG